MSMIDFSELALSPNESRAARNFFGLSQAQAAAKSNLPAHKIKRFESGNYVPDSQFLEALREFYEAEGYNFHDEDAPGAKAKARGDVFPSGVVGETTVEPGETAGSPEENQGKLPRPQKINLQYMRITPDLDTEQIDRVLSCIEENEETIAEAIDTPIGRGFLSEGPSGQSQAQAIALLRRLAENGLLYASLMGRNPLAEVTVETSVTAPKKAQGGIFFAGQDMSKMQWKTIGQLLATAMADLQAAVLNGDREAQARRKGRAEPTEVLQALVG